MQKGEDEKQMIVKEANRLKTQIEVQNAHMTQQKQT